MLRKRMVAHQWPIPVIVAIIAVGLLLVIGVKYDYPLYHDPVATITSVKMVNRKQKMNSKIRILKHLRNLLEKLEMGHTKIKSEAQ